MSGREFCPNGGLLHDNQNTAIVLTDYLTYSGTE